jgi:hypothetical protein
MTSGLGTRILLVEVRGGLSGRVDGRQSRGLGLFRELIWRPLEGGGGLLGGERGRRIGLSGVGFGIGSRRGVSRQGLSRGRKLSGSKSLKGVG